MTGRIVDIKRFAVHDGPGIRTTVFLKGCSLACLWCHNPESISGRPELAYYEQKCIHCGSCVAACPVGAHSMENGRHVFDRSKCIGSGDCAQVCLGNALVFYGKEMTAAEVMAVILEDVSFYEHSGGGLTLSGGEPLLQHLFCREVLQLAKKQPLHTAIDTCGAVPWKNFESVIDLTDLFLFDVKHMNSEDHRRVTGSGNELILENLTRLSETGKAIEIRIPLVPGINDDDANIARTGQFLSRLKNITKVRVLPYHSFARSKYAALGKKDTMPDVASPSDEKLDQIVDQLTAYGVQAISGRR